MADLPAKAAKLYLRDFINQRDNAYAGRIINPSTGRQEEVFAEQVEFICPLCKFTQLAPVENNVEYACPRCDMRYLVENEMLAIWQTKDVGVETIPLAPGARVEDRDTEHLAILDAPGDQVDPEKVKYEYDKSRGEFVKRMVNDPAGDGLDFDKKIQVGHDGRSDKK